MRRLACIALVALSLLLVSGPARAEDETRIVPGPYGRPLVSRVVHPGETRPKEFGVNGTEYTHIAGAFSGVGSDVIWGSNFYMYPAADATWVVADLGIPDGVFLQSLTMFYEDFDLPTDLTLSLCAGATHPDGSNPNFYCFWAVTADTNTGYNSVTMDVNSTIRYSTDIDGDGTRDDVRWMVFVYFPSATALTYLGGVRAAWNRQVSPAPSAATFTDVPTSSPQFQFIEALAASGITAGCGGGNFCPNAPLTRGQMAVFLAKALGLYWSAATP